MTPASCMPRARPSSRSGTTWNGNSRGSARASSTGAAGGAPLVEVVDDLERQFPGIRARIVDGDGAVHAFVNIFVNDEDIRFLQGLATPLTDQADVSIIPAMAGGAHLHH